MPSRNRSTASSCARAYSSFFRLSSTLVDCFRPLDARMVVPSRHSVSPSMIFISRHERAKTTKISF